MQIGKLSSFGDVKEFAQIHLFILRIFIKSLLSRNWSCVTKQDIHCLSFHKTYVLTAGGDSINKKVKSLKSLVLHLSQCEHLFSASNFLVFFLTFCFSEWAGCLPSMPPNAPSCLPGMLTSLENNDNLPWPPASCWFQPMGNTNRISEKGRRVRSEYLLSQLLSCRSPQVVCLLNEDHGSMNQYTKSYQLQFLTPCSC